MNYLSLPSEVSPFEATYLRRMNKIALGFFWLHPPVFALVAYLSGTSELVALLLSAGAMIGPTIAYFAFASRPRLVSTIYGVTSMLMGGVLVYIGQGPMQIEMHFYFFVLIALLAVFANPRVIIAAAATVAVHHFVVWLLLPRGVFNYEASFWTVFVHAVFVVIESVAAVFVARSFFDNVIGLEKIVATRTAALDGRNQDMARILDNVAQGFVSTGLDGKLGGEWSHALEAWFGKPTTDTTLWDYLYTDAEARDWMRISFDAIAEGFMPIELTLEQLPHRFTKDAREFRIDYLPIGSPVASLLVVISDVTAEVARERAEQAQRELVTVIEKAIADRAGFNAFVNEAEELVLACVAAEGAALRRHIHTLKGNCALFGVTTLASLCHEIETMLADRDDLETRERERLRDTWRSFRDRIDRLLGRTDRALVVDLDEYNKVIASIPLPEPMWAQRLREWGNAPTRPRLEQCAQYARNLASRLGKDVVVELADHEVRVPNERYAPVWSNLVHAIRNMVDHGIETPDVRAAAGKPEQGVVKLETTMSGSDLVIAISDDGAGIDWDRIAGKARALGLPAETPADLEEALFANGLSTRDDVSDTSGRGVGMDALRMACRSLNGRIRVESVRGQGTRITCTLPTITRTRSFSKPIPVSA